MTELDSLALARAVAEREARCLDLRLWDEWLSVFTEDCVFWVPTYRADGELSDDPRTQVSHIFYDQRSDTNVTSGSAAISSKKVIVFNDVIPTMADVYCF